MITYELPLDKFGCKEMIIFAYCSDVIYENFEMIDTQARSRKPLDNCEDK